MELRASTAYAAVLRREKVSVQLQRAMPAPPFLARSVGFANGSKPATATTARNDLSTNSAKRLEETSASNAKRKRASTEGVQRSVSPSTLLEETGWSFDCVLREHNKTEWYGKVTVNSTTVRFEAHLFGLRRLWQANQGTAEHFERITNKVTT